MCIIACDREAVGLIEYVCMYEYVALSGCAYVCLWSCACVYDRDVIVYVCALMRACVYAHVRVSMCMRRRTSMCVRGRLCAHTCVCAKADVVVEGICSDVYVQDRRSTR